MSLQRGVLEASKCVAALRSCHVEPSPSQRKHPPRSFRAAFRTSDHDDARPRAFRSKQEHSEKSQARGDWSYAQRHGPRSRWLAVDRAMVPRP